MGIQEAGHPQLLLCLDEGDVEQSCPLPSQRGLVHQPLLDRVEESGERKAILPTGTKIRHLLLGLLEEGPLCEARSPCQNTSLILHLVLQNEYPQQTHEHVLLQGIDV